MNKMVESSNLSRSWQLKEYSLILAHPDPYPLDAAISNALREQGEPAVTAYLWEGSRKRRPFDAVFGVVPTPRSGRLSCPP